MLGKMFAESEFVAACQEIDTPNLIDWEFFTQSYSREINVYRRYNEKSGLYAYKIFGTMDVPFEICSKVYMDTEYRRVWDPYMKDVRQVTHGSRSGIYWHIYYPFPMSRRDLLVVRDSRYLTIDNRKICVILSRADDALSEAEPLPKNTIRIRTSDQAVAITANGPSSTKAFGYYYEDPGGLIPSWMINWAAKTGVPGLLAATEKGCQDYPDYIRKMNGAKENEVPISMVSVTGR